MIRSSQSETESNVVFFDILETLRSIASITNQLAQSISEQL